MSEQTVSLQQIADHAGVSAMTVSRVLRRLPGASQATIEKIKKAAEDMEYQPDPELTRAMNLVRGRKKKRRQSVIAVIREHVPNDELDGNVCHFVPLNYIRESAAQHGYETEEFWLGRDKLTAQRLSEILHARGVEGIIVSPQSVSMPCKDIDYSKFASVTLSYAMKSPSLHRSTTNAVPGIQFAFQQLQLRGYKRIGIAMSKWADDRTQNVYSSGLLHYQHGLSRLRRVPLLMFPHNDIRQDEKIFCQWVKKHKPDALITFEKYVPNWLIKMGLRIPEDIGLVVHDWVPGMKRWAGINHRRDYIAHGAVDLLVMQLMRNERGVPQVPRQISIPPEWVDGPSIKSM